MKAISKATVSDDFQERKDRAEKGIKEVLDKEGLGIQAIIQRTDTKDEATLIFLDVRAINKAQEEVESKEEKKDEETKSDKS